MADCVAAIVLLSSCCEPLVVSESPVLGVNARTSAINASTLPIDFTESNSYVSEDSTRGATVLLEQAQELDHQLVDLQQT